MLTKNEKLIFKPNVYDDVYLILKHSILRLASVSCCLQKPAAGADFSGVLRPVKIEKKGLIIWNVRNTCGRGLFWIVGGSQTKLISKEVCMFYFGLDRKRKQLRGRKLHILEE